jgi:hypothetical protein
MPAKRRWTLDYGNKHILRKRPGVIRLTPTKKAEWEADTLRIAREQNKADLEARKRRRQGYIDDDDAPIDHSWPYSWGPDDNGGNSEIDDELDYDVVSPGWIDETDEEDDDDDDDDDDIELCDTTDALAGLTISKDGSPSRKEMTDLNKRIEDIQRREARKASRMVSRAKLLTNWQKFVSVATGDMAFNTFEDEKRPCMKCGSTDTRSLPVVSFAGDCRHVCSS